MRLLIIILLLFGFVGKVRSCAPFCGKNIRSLLVESEQTDFILHKRVKRQSVGLFNQDSMPDVGGCTNCSQMFASKHIVQKQIINQIVHQIVENNRQHDDQLDNNKKVPYNFRNNNRKSDVGNRYGQQRIIFRGEKSANADKTSIHIHGRAQDAKSNKKQDVSSQSRRTPRRKPKRKKRKKSIQSSYQRSSKSRKVIRQRRKLREIRSNSQSAVFHRHHRQVRRIERREKEIDEESSSSESVMISDSRESDSNQPKSYEEKSQSSSSSSQSNDDSGSYEKSNQKSNNRRIFGTKNFLKDGNTHRVNVSRHNAKETSQLQISTNKHRKKCSPKRRKGSQSGELGEWKYLMIQTYEIGKIITFVHRFTQNSNLKINHAEIVNIIF
jgi:hypothetical protein